MTVLVGPGSEWATLWMACRAIAELVGLIAGGIIVLSFAGTLAWIGLVEWQQKRAQLRARRRIEGWRG